MKIDIVWTNGVKMGEAIQAEDGFFKFFPESRGGYWDEGTLQYVIDKLKELNKPWDDHLNEAFSP